jgi:hypothetical protein
MALFAMEALSFILALRPPAPFRLPPGPLFQRVCLPGPGLHSRALLEEGQSSRCGRLPGRRAGGQHPLRPRRLKRPACLPSSPSLAHPPCLVLGRFMARRPGRRGVGALDILRDPPSSRLGPPPQLGIAVLAFCITYFKTPVRPSWDCPPGYGSSSVWV